MLGVLSPYTHSIFYGPHSRSWLLGTRSAILALHFYVYRSRGASKPCTRRNHTSTSASSLDGCYPRKSGYCPCGRVSEAFNCKQVRYNLRTHSCRRRLSTGHSQAGSPGTRPGTHRTCLPLPIPKWRPELSSCSEVGLGCLDCNGVRRFLSLKFYLTAQVDLQE